VKNVVQQKKADANRKRVLNVLKQGPCKKRMKKNLPVAAVPVKQRNNPSLSSPCQKLWQGLFSFSLFKFFCPAKPGI